MYPRQSRARWTSALLVSLCLAHVAGAQCSVLPRSGKPVPAIQGESLDGKPLRIASYRGSVVLLNFWATWCQPCMAEMPAFNAWQSQLGPRGLQVVGISMDDSPSAAKHAVARLRLGYPVVMGEEQIATKFGGVLGLPVSFLVDRRGNIRRRFDGASDLSALKQQIECLLNKR